MVLKNMKTKSLIELREIDLQVLEGIDVGASINKIGKIVFPYASQGRGSVNTYIRKHLKLGLITRLKPGKFKLTDSGRYFIKILDKLNDEIEYPITR